MSDTTKEMEEMQIGIILSKTPEERAKMGFDMIDSVYKVVKNSIKQEHPDWSEREVTVEVFKRYYAGEFSVLELVKITNSLTNTESMPDSSVNS